MKSNSETFSKVPEVTLGFWVVKILATTLGETGGDTVTMTWLRADAHPHNGGYLMGTLIFSALFVAAVFAQILAKKFNPWIYWLAIVASTTVGTAMADYFDRSLGIGYSGGSRFCWHAYCARSRSGTSPLARSMSARLRHRKWKSSIG